MFTQDIFRAFTRGFDDLLLAYGIGTIWFSVPFMTGLSTFERRYQNQLYIFLMLLFSVAFLTQVFYCYRIAILTRSRYAVVLIAMVGDKVLSAVYQLC